VHKSGFAALDAGDLKLAEYTAVAFGYRALARAPNVGVVGWGNYLTTLACKRGVAFTTLAVGEEERQRKGGGKGGNG